jgi:DNA-binding transcriptional regulator YdaS (Cro superfamily)
MRLMILEERKLRDTFRASKGTVSIGSDEGCDVHLPDPRLGSRHLEITLDKAGIWWLDVRDTTIPTCLNRSVQKTRAKLRHADEIEVGPFSIRFLTESDKSREELQHERILELTKRHGESLPLGTIILKENADLTVSREHLEQFTLLTIRLSHTESIGDAMAPALRAMTRTFDARRAWIGVRKSGRGDFDWTSGQSAQGQPCVRPPFSASTESRCMDHAQHVCTPSVPMETVGSAMAVPLVGEVGTIGMLYVENDPEDEPYAKGSLHALKAMATAVAIPIQNVIRQTVAVRRAAADTGLTIARATQDAVTLQALPQWEEFQVAAYRLMGTEKCCDFYDIVQLRDKTAAIVVARLSVDTQTLPRYLAELHAAFRCAALYSEAPHIFARAVNWILFAAGSKNTIDLAAAWVSPKTGQVVHCVAGRRIIVGRILPDGACEMVQPEQNPSICEARSPAFDSKSFVLAPENTLVLATAGINAARNEQGDVFGVHGLKENLCDGLGEKPGQMLNEFATDLNEFVAGGANPEDVTVVLVRRE